MARLTIYKDNLAETTAVSNLFIDEYMGEANDAQLKVYLYLLRMMNAHLSTSVSDIADKFNHTERDVIRSLEYWRDKQLLDLDYEGRNLVGIRIRQLGDVCPVAEQQPATFVPAPSEFVQPLPLAAVTTSTLAPAMNSNTGITTGRNVPSSAGTVEMAKTFQKPSYNADQLRAFKNSQDTAQLLFIAETYIGRPLTPADMKSILFFKDVLNFSDDLIDYLLQYCVDKDKKDFKYIEKVAISWAERGITTPEEAEKTAYRYDSNVYTIMNGLGKNGSPSPKEMEFISRWMKDYGFSTDIIIEACERTVLATDKHRFEYAESILSSWREQNVHHKSDILRIDDMYQQRKKNNSSSSSSSSARPSANRFTQFTQNTYDFEALEKELLSN